MKSPTDGESGSRSALVDLLSEKTLLAEEHLEELIRHWNRLVEDPYIKGLGLLYLRMAPGAIRSFVNFLKTLIRFDEIQDFKIGSLVHNLGNPERPHSLINRATAIAEAKGVSVDTIMTDALWFYVRSAERVYEERNREIESDG